MPQFSCPKKNHSNEKHYHGIIPLIQNREQLFPMWFQSFCHLLGFWRIHHKRILEAPKYFQQRYRWAESKQKEAKTDVFLTDSNSYWEKSPNTGYPALEVLLIFRVPAIFPVIPGHVSQSHSLPCLQPPGCQLLGPLNEACGLTQTMPGRFRGGDGSWGLALNLAGQKNDRLGC